MDRRKLAQDTERIIHKYMCTEDTKRNYGTDLLLTRKEIHTVQLVGDSPGINLSALAAHHGVTKGAASQMISRLCEKGLLKREISVNSLAEIALFLTPKGRQALHGHEAYHARMDTVWHNALAGMSEQDVSAVERFLATIETLLDEEGAKANENSHCF